MTQCPTFNTIINRYGFGNGSDCPLSYLLVESTEETAMPLIPSERTSLESLEQGPHERKTDDPATAISRLFRSLFDGDDVDCIRALNIIFTDDNAQLDVGGVATLDGILKVMYLCPDYLEYRGFGMGWFLPGQVEVKDTFDLTFLHAKAILAAGQTQLDDMGSEEATSVLPPQEVSYTPRVETNHFKRLTSTGSCFLLEPDRH